MLHPFPTSPRSTSPTGTRNPVLKVFVQSEFRQGFALAVARHHARLLVLTDPWKMAAG